MSQPLLLEFFAELTGKRRVTPKSLGRFVERTSSRYNEGTLCRLLQSNEPRVREAALVALRFLGGMRVTPQIIPLLRDESEDLRQVAEATLWTIWFRNDGNDHGEELQRLAQLIADEEYRKALTGLNKLIKKAPSYAEAYNQRAILHWQRKDYERSLQDCQRVLDLNPYHFGAQAGLGQCFLGLHRPVEALASFRKALKINPNLSGVEASIQELEQLIEEEGLS